MIRDGSAPEPVRAVPHIDKIGGSNHAIFQSRHNGSRFEHAPRVEIVVKRDAIRWFIMRTIRAAQITHCHNSSGRNLHKDSGSAVALRFNHPLFQRFVGNPLQINVNSSIERSATVRFLQGYFRPNASNSLLQSAPGFAYQKRIVACFQAGSTFGEQIAVAIA